MLACGYYYNFRDYHILSHLLTSEKNYFYHKGHKVFSQCTQGHMCIMPCDQLEKLALSHSLQKKRVIMGCMKIAEILAQSVYYIFRDYLIILTLATHPPWRTGF